MVYEYRTKSSRYVLNDETNFEFLGFLRLGDDNYWRFRPSLDHSFTVRELTEIATELSFLNTKG